MTLFICEVCNKEFASKQALGGHKSSAHKDTSRYSVKRKHKKRRPKDTNIYYCQYCNNKKVGKNSHSNHERYCPSNPNRNYKNGMTGKKGGNQYTKANKLRLPKPKITEETREKLSRSMIKANLERPNEVNEKISKSMKKAHAEGRAGRWNPIEKYRISNKTCRLYIVFAKYNGLEFIKIGITEQTVSKRLGKVFDEYKVLYDIQLENGYFIARFEKYLLDCFSDKKTKVGNFIGYTECFDTNIHDDIEKNITKFLFTNTE